MQLSVLHYHFRPGGVRRVIELGLPALIQAAGGLTRVVMAAGEAPDTAWRQLIEVSLFPCKVEWVVEPALGYWSEQRAPAAEAGAAIHECLRRILLPGSVLWAHNLSVGRNMLLAQALCSLATDAKLWLHHHDWWWDGRWERWPEMRAQGIDSLEEAMALTLPTGPGVRHCCINVCDARRLKEWAGIESSFLPNPAAQEIPDAAEGESARKFLRRVTGTDESWIYPCRALRRKNIAEALLVQRLMAPGGAIVTTGAASSPAEQPYFDMLCKAVSRNHWPLHMAVCARPDAPSPRSLMAASRAAVITSLREGFGLTYQEAAQRALPLLARIPSGLAETFEAVGFRFRSAWTELRVPRHLFDEKEEAMRIAFSKSRLASLLPDALRTALSTQNAYAEPCVDFGRLTLQAQLEVLSTATREACLPLNPVLDRPSVPQTPAVAMRAPVQWAEAFLEHVRMPASPPLSDKNWSRHATSFLTPLVQDWLRYPLLWASLTAGAESTGPNASVPA
jgi:hypothetical protein